MITFRSAWNRRRLGNVVCAGALLSATTSSVKAADLVGGATPDGDSLSHGSDHVSSDRAMGPFMVALGVT